MKVCSKCKVEKDESEFYKNKSKKSGFHSECKICHNSWRQTENGKKILKDYFTSEKYKKTLAKYRHSEKGKILYNSEKYKNYRKAYQQLEKVKESKKNMPHYLKNLLNLNGEKLIVPIELLELKKVQIQLKRKIKEIENENKQH